MINVVKKNKNVLELFDVTDAERKLIISQESDDSLIWTLKTNSMFKLFIVSRELDIMVYYYFDNLFEIMADDTEDRIIIQNNDNNSLNSNSVTITRHEDEIVLYFQQNDRRNINDDNEISVKVSESTVLLPFKANYTNCLSLVKPDEVDYFTI